MSRIYVDEYDKVAAIVRGDNPDEFGLFECQQRLLAWASAAYVLERQRDEAHAALRDLVGAFEAPRLSGYVEAGFSHEENDAINRACDVLRRFITEEG